MKSWLLVGVFMMAGVWAASIENQMDDDNLDTAEETDQAPKINWEPVWSDTESRDPVIFTRDEEKQPQAEANVSDVEEEPEEAVQIPVEASIHIHQHPDSKAESCSTEKNRGLKNLLEVSKLLVPMADIKSLLYVAASDEEVKGFLRLIKSPAYREKVSIVRDSKEYKELQEFNCKFLRIDMKYLAEYVRRFFDFPEVEVEGKQSGIKGVIEQISMLLPMKDLREIFEQFYKNDEELRQTVAYIKSNEYERLLSDLRNLPELKEIRQMMEERGVPVNAAVTLVNEAVGWNVTGFNAEDILISF